MNDIFTFKFDYGSIHSNIRHNHYSKIDSCKLKIINTLAQERSKPCSVSLILHPFDILSVTFNCKLSEAISVYGMLQAVT